MFIVGDVGSGKSSLLSAFIGELLFVSPKLIENKGGLAAKVDDLKMLQDEFI